MKIFKRIRFARLANTMASMAIAVAIFSFSLGVYFVISSEGQSSLIIGNLVSLFISTAYAIVGRLVASRYPRNPIGWIFLSVSWLDAIILTVSIYQNFGPEFELSGYVPAIFKNLWLPATSLTTIFTFLLFPDGRLISSRWRFVFWLAVAGLFGIHFAIALHPGPINYMGIGSNPDGVVSLKEYLDIILPFTLLLLGIGIVGSLISFGIRFFRAQGIERQQMKWLGFALSLMLISMIFSSIAWGVMADNGLITQLSDLVSNLAVLGIAVATGIAILRYRLYDIDVIINRTLVYAALTSSVVGIYVIVVGGLGIFFQAQGNLIIALLATGIVAALFQPIRERLQRLVNRLIYGERDDPIEALSRLGSRLEVSITPDEVLPTLVKTIAQTLKLPYVAILLPEEVGDWVAASHGQPSALPVNFPLIYQGRTIGKLSVVPRYPETSFRPSEMLLLQNIARQAGSTVQAAQLMEDLQRSRQGLVTAREEERRRLRRDLHDGLGPTLAALHIQANALRRVILKDPKAAEIMVSEFDAEIREAIDDIRRVVYELRPPTLDELGLVGATRAFAANCSREVVGLDDPDSEHYAEQLLSVHVEAPTELPPLPAAVEVAAYHVIREALTNVFHHAHAHQCVVSFYLTDALVVEIVDDGFGLPAEFHAGVGMLSMRERTEELGGTFVIEPGLNSGTLVKTRFPIRKG